MRGSLRIRAFLLSGLILGVGMVELVAQSWAMAPNQSKVPDQYIIKVQPQVRASAIAQKMAAKHGLGLTHVYEYALNGFSARVPKARLSLLRQDSQIVSVVQDRYVTMSKPPCGTPPCGGGDNGGGDPPPEPQTTPTGVLRIHGDQSSTLAGNGAGTVDVDVAVIDTGIVNHDDLNVVGGMNCSNGPSSRYSDGNGHGTHVAGTIGALDNDLGVVGVAPGVRLWAVRVLNNNGSGSWSSVICGIDYVTANAGTIEVANMSLGGNRDSSDSCTDGGLREAICNSVAAGVTYVVAAGNSSTDAANEAPSGYEEVITVSALADFDGIPGGTGNETCRLDEDDTLANFSNYGSDVDLIAPGVCIESTWNDGGYNTISGTSMVAPHVAGAAALYKSLNPGATPSQVQSALETAGNTNWNHVDDPDGVKESLLDVSTF